MALRLAPLAAAALLAYGCQGDSGAYDDVANWLCFEDDAACACYGVEEPSGVQDERERVGSCSPELDCCFVIDRGAEGYECVCLSSAVLAAEAEAEGGTGGMGGESSGSAGAESGEDATDAKLLCTKAALDRGSPTTVGHCPPITLDDASVCAFFGESCERDYLEEQGLIACCEGTHCGQNAFGEKVCVR